MRKCEKKERSPLSLTCWLSQRATCLHTKHVGSESSSSSATKTADTRVAGRLAAMAPAPRTGHTPSRMQTSLGSLVSRKMPINSSVYCLTKASHSVSLDLKRRVHTWSRAATTASSVLLSRSFLTAHSATRLQIMQLTTFPLDGDEEDRSGSLVFVRRRAGYAILTKGRCLLLTSSNSGCCLGQKPAERQRARGSTWSRTHLNTLSRSWSRSARH